MDYFFIKCIKRTISLAVTVTLLCSHPLTVAAKSDGNLPEGELFHKELAEYAVGLPSMFPATSHWEEVRVNKVTELFDVDEKLFSYCVDVCNLKTDQLAYAIIRPDIEILEYHPSSGSLYQENSKSRLYYNGVGKYYKKRSNTTLENLKTGVPDYLWYRGCVPTSLAMAIRYKFGSKVDSGRTLAKKLATNLDMVDGDQVFVNGDMENGILKYLKSKGVKATCGFENEDFVTKAPMRGTKYNPLNTYKSYINGDIPVMISMVGSKGTSDTYNKGFGEHAVCGTGYYTGSAGNFVIVHTTGAEGDVYVAYSSYALGDFCWFIIY